MSYLLETLGRGLLGQLLDAFAGQLPGDGPEALADLQARLTQAPTSADLAIRLGVLLVREQRCVEAQAILRRVPAAHPQRRQAVIAQACAADELGQHEDALALVTQAAELDPRDPAAAFAVGYCQERLGREAEAVRAYRRAAELCPRLRNAHERLAALAVRAGQWTRALTCYRTLSELEPGDLGVSLTLGMLQLLDDEPAAAAETLQRALLIESPCHDEDLAAADRISDEDQLRHAIITVQRLVEKYPGVPEFHVHLGDLYVKGGEDDRALTQYAAALELHPQFLEATIKLGTQHLRRGRFEDAARYFNRAVELNDRLLLGLVGLTLAQRACGREREADATLTLAGGLEPNSTLLMSEATRLHLKAEALATQRGDSAAVSSGTSTLEDTFLFEAIQRHRQGAINCPGDADLHYRYGVLLRQVGQVEQASEALAEAVRLAPGCARALLRLGLVQAERGQRPESAVALQAAFAADERQIELHYQLAILFSDRARFQLALERIEHTAASECQAAEQRANLTLALQNVGMVDRPSTLSRCLSELPRGVEMGRRFSEAGAAVDWFQS